jgi:hypothetical protein
MTVSSTGSSGSAATASQITALQKQLQKDVAKQDADAADRADAQTLQLDRLAVQADQQQIAALQRAQEQTGAAPTAGPTATPTRGGTNSAVQPGTAAADGSVYL